MPLKGRGIELNKSDIKNIYFFLHFTQNEFCVFLLFALEPEITGVGWKQFENFFC